MFSGPIGIYKQSFLEELTKQQRHDQLTRAQHNTPTCNTFYNRKNLNVKITLTRQKGVVSVLARSSLYSWWLIDCQVGHLMKGDMWSLKRRYKEERDRSLTWWRTTEAKQELGFWNLKISTVLRMNRKVQLNSHAFSNLLNEIFGSSKIYWRNFSKFLFIIYHLLNKQNTTESNHMKILIK